MSEHKYERIARMIRADLPDPGEVIPSESMLQEQYGVSRSTVRQALDALETEGLISSSQGSRRIVRDGKRWCWEMSTWEKTHRADADAWALNIQAQGGQPDSIIQVSVVAAPSDVASALEVEEGESVVARLRVRMVDGQPHQLSDSYFPRWLTDANPVFTDPGDQAAPGGLLAASGHPQTRVHDSIAARMPSADEARALLITPTTPLLVHSRTGYDKDGRPVRHMVSRMAADRVEISYDLDL